MKRSSQNLWHAKVSRGRIRRFCQRNLLPEARLHFIGAIRGGCFAFRCQSAERRLDVTCINRVKLLDIGDDFRNLGGEHFAFVVGNVQVRQLRDPLNVRFRYGHKFR